MEHWNFFRPRRPYERPTIGEVEVGLEHALELQECAGAAMRKDDSILITYPIVKYTCSASIQDWFKVEIKFRSNQKKCTVTENGMFVSDITATVWRFLLGVIFSLGLEMGLILVLLDMFNCS